MKNFVKKATSLKAAIAAGIMAPVTMTAVVAPAPAQAQDVGDILGDIVEGVTRDAARDLRRAPREARREARREAQRERREVRRVDQYVGREAADGDIPLGAIPAIRQCAYSLTIQYNFRARDAVESCVNEYNRQRAARYTPRR
tara:strand:+ start:889 stop:1317 length:429 start_codon:yes stop_codon:yes gene_type:complete